MGTESSLVFRGRNILWMLVAERVKVLADAFTQLCDAGGILVGCKHSDGHAGHEAIQDREFRGTHGTVEEIVGVGVGEEGDGWGLPPGRTDVGGWVKASSS